MVYIVIGYLSDRTIIDKVYNKYKKAENRTSFLENNILRWNNNPLREVRDRCKKLKVDLVYSNVVDWDIIKREVY